MKSSLSAGFWENDLECFAIDYYSINEKITASISKATTVLDMTNVDVTATSQPSQTTNGYHKFGNY